MTSGLETERAYSVFQHFINLSLTYLLRHLPTYSARTHMWQYIFNNDLNKMDYFSMHTHTVKVG